MEYHQVPDIVTSNRVIVFALFTGVVDLVNEIYSGSHEQWHIKGFKRFAPMVAKLSWQRSPRPIGWQRHWSFL